MAGIALGLFKHPATPVLYATHTATFANKQSKRIRKLAQIAGVKLAPGSNRVDEWETTSGGGVVARGVGGEVTGRGFKVIIVDDPFKSRELADSAVHRERVWAWLRDDVFTRGTPDCAVIIIHTRYHPDDAIGRLMKEGWSGLVLRALAEEDDPLGRAPGEPLWPQLWPVERLEKRRRRVGEFGWASLFQGRPRPRGGRVFNDPRFYRELPKDFRRAYGIDLAYTAKSQADKSVCVEILRSDVRVAPGEKKRDPVFYIPWVLTMQVAAPVFTARLQVRQARSKAPMLFLCSGTEKGAASFIEERVPMFKVETVNVDKFTRAQEFAAAWNDGRVLLPDPETHEKVPWLSDFLDVICNFTGVNDAEDDEVDAAVAGHRQLTKAKVGPLAAYGWGVR